MYGSSSSTSLYNTIYTVCLSGGTSPSIEARSIRGYGYLPASGTGTQKAIRYITLAFVCTSPPRILA